MKYHCFSCNHSDLTRVIIFLLCIYIASHAGLHAYFIFRILLSTWAKWIKIIVFAVLYGKFPTSLFAFPPSRQNLSVQVLGRCTYCEFLAVCAKCRIYIRQLIVWFRWVPQQRSHKSAVVRCVITECGANLCSFAVDDGKITEMKCLMFWNRNIKFVS